MLKQCNRNDVSLRVSAVKERRDFLKEIYSYLVLFIKDLKNGGDTFSYNTITQGEVLFITIHSNMLSTAAKNFLMPILLLCILQSIIFPMNYPLKLAMFSTLSVTNAAK